MVIFFGQPGSGKSTQGKLLAANKDWCWISAGQLLRDSDDPSIDAILNSGKLVPFETICGLVGDALSKCNNVAHVVIDGFARNIGQSRWLIENGIKYNRAVELIVVIEIDEKTIIERLSSRGRKDDTEQAIRNRLDIYKEETYPVLDYFRKEGIKIVYIDGSGTPEQVHVQIMKEVELCKLA
ncbi:MAG: adenylate kinase [Patescibacteria group bacterium]|nr:adenylate kinase [Patescibacteria group bacterium]